MEKALFRIGWGLIAGLAAFLFATTTIYFSFADDINFLAVKQEVVHNVLWRTAFYIHITGGMLALLIGPFQFIRRIRHRRRALHRNLGKAYMVSILFLAGPSGLFMAFYAEGGFYGALGFVLMAVLWLWTTFRAYETIRRRDVPGHIRWITRSYALSFAAVTLRLYVPATTLTNALDPEFVVVSSAWISWIPNLIVAEMLLRWFPQRL